MKSYDISLTPVFLLSTKNIHKSSTIQKSNEKKNKKNILKIEGDVGMSKPKKHANKVGRFHITLHKYSSLCFALYWCEYFLGIDIPTSSIFIENVLHMFSVLKATLWLRHS